MTTSPPPFDFSHWKFFPSVRTAQAAAAHAAPAWCSACSRAWCGLCSPGVVRRMQPGMVQRVQPGVVRPVQPGVVRRMQPMQLRRGAALRSAGSQSAGNEHGFLSQCVFSVSCISEYSITAILQM